MKPAMALLGLYCHAADASSPRGAFIMFTGSLSEHSQTPPPQRVHIIAVNGHIDRTHYHEIKVFILQNGS